ncbi:hypothetical protein [Vibrio parahaemolyticus]|uniref:hypothetical protein n=1 Tax=Vibrio parahaemolyticus TaxID=670 RepID=UPI00111F7A28|nr:hypothetical protein [Vibrio parahaemolyticus]TOL88665.1 hypothetical protein CGH88_22945 [Vibrio parahaemolyticus]
MYEESQKSKVLNVYIPAGLGAILVIGSIVMDIFWAAKDPWYWAQRSGAVLTIIGALIGFHENNESMKFIDGNLLINKEISYRYLSLGYVLFGTFLWGYGDIVFKLFL